MTELDSSTSTQPQQPPLFSWGANDSWSVALFAVLAFLFALPMWLGGDWFVSHEYIHALVRFSEFHTAFTEGQFPPRWASNMTAGFGYPFFTFFPPLSFFIAEIFHLIGFSLAGAWKAELVFVRFLGIVGMYLFLRVRMKPCAAFAGAIFFAAAHYHSNTLYVRGNIQEFTALNIWPWAFFGLEAAVRLPRRSIAIPLAAIPVAAVVMTHLLTGYMFSIALAIWGVFLLFEAWQKRGKAGAVYQFVSLAMVGVLSVMLSSFFALTAVLEMSAVQPDALMGIQLNEHFIWPLQLFTPVWGYGLSFPGPNDTMSFALGWGLWAGLALSVVAMIRLKGRVGPFVYLVTGLFLCCCLAMFSISEPIWRLVPGSSFLQFPWRVLIPTTFFGTVLAGWGTGEFLEKLQVQKLYGKIVFAVILAIPLGFLAPYLQPSLYWVTVPTVDEQWSRQRISNGTANEYLPVGVMTLPVWASTDRVLWKQGRGQGELIERTGIKRVYHVECASPGTVMAETFWYPGWSVRIGDRYVRSWPEGEYGLIGWDQPAGSYEVTLELGNTPLRATTNGLTLLAIAIIIGWCVFSVRKRRVGQKTLKENES